MLEILKMVNESLPKNYIIRRGVCKMKKLFIIVLCSIFITTLTGCHKLKEDGDFRYVFEMI